VGLSEGTEALRGAFGFLTRLRIGHDEADWEAFRANPGAFVLVAYPVGALVSLSLFVPGTETSALALLLLVYLVCGINHVDGLADCADAAVVHGDSERRREVMKDTTTGVGALVAVALVVAGLGLAGLALASLPLLVAVGLVIAAEVGAKLAMALVVCLGKASHEGFGSSFTEANGARDAIVPALTALPVLVLAPVTGAVALLASVGVALAALSWSKRHLGGVSGDVIGATNEFGRLAALHFGVIAWTLW
jgi:adenosylcobinamide-GDP ribazoletransferase